MENKINKTSFKKALMTTDNMKEFISSLTPEEQTKYSDYLTKFQDLHSEVKNTARANIHAMDVEGFIYENNQLKNDKAFMGLLTTIGTVPIAVGVGLAVTNDAKELAAVFITGLVGLYSTYNHMSNKFKEYETGQKTVNNAVQSVEVYGGLVERYANLARSQFELSQMLKDWHKDKLKNKLENTETEKQIIKLSISAFAELESANDKLGSMLGKFELKVKDEIKSRRQNITDAERDGTDVKPDLIYGKGKEIRVHDASPSTLVIAKAELEKADKKFEKLVSKRGSEVAFAKRTSDFVKGDIIPTMAPTFTDKVANLSSNIYSRMVNAVSETIGVGSEKVR